MPLVLVPTLFPSYSTLSFFSLSSATSPTPPLILYILKNNTPQPLFRPPLRYVYQLNEEGPEEGDTGGGGGEGEGGGGGEVVSQYTHWGLPSQEFEGVWESLLYEDEDEAVGEEEEGGQEESRDAIKRPRLEGSSGGAGAGAAAPATTATHSNPSPVTRGVVEGELSGSRLKPALLQYASSAMAFADAGVDGGLISCNHVILLHGPPGTGKTSLCKALAHKLSIRLSHRYPSAQLIEINAHSLFSRWFSESGKLVHKLFAHIREMVEDDDCLVMLLIDEVSERERERGGEGGVGWGKRE